MLRRIDKNAPLRSSEAGRFFTADLRGPLALATPALLITTFISGNIATLTLLITAFITASIATLAPLPAS